MTNCTVDFQCAQKCHWRIQCWMHLINTRVQLLVCRVHHIMKICSYLVELTMKFVSTTWNRFAFQALCILIYLSTTHTWYLNAFFVIFLTSLVKVQLLQIHSYCC